MPCFIPVVKVVVGSNSGGVGFLVILAQGGGPEILFYMPSSDLGGLHRPKITKAPTSAWAHCDMGVRSTVLTSP